MIEGFNLNLVCFVSNNTNFSCRVLKIRISTSMSLSLWWVSRINKILTQGSVYISNFQFQVIFTPAIVYNDMLASHLESFEISWKYLKFCHKGRPQLIRGTQSGQSVLLFSWLEIVQTNFLRLEVELDSSRAYERRPALTT